MNNKTFFWRLAQVSLKLDSWFITNMFSFEKNLENFNGEISIIKINYRQHNRHRLEFLTFRNSSTFPMERVVKKENNICIHYHS